MIEQRGGMGKLARDTIEHVKLVGWAVFLIYVILAALTVLFGRHIGYGTMGWIGLGFASLVTAVFAGIFAINLILSLIIRAYRYLRRSKDSV